MSYPSEVPTIGAKAFRLFADIATLFVFGLVMSVPALMVVSSCPIERQLRSVEKVVEQSKWTEAKGSLVIRALEAQREAQVKKEFDEFEKKRKEDAR